MSKHKIPTELIELENRLRTRADPGPPADLRTRVLHAVAAELAPPRQTPANPQWQSGWWPAIAAAVLIVLNLSMVSASRNQFSNRPKGDARQQMTLEFQAIRQLEAQKEGTFR